ncbi:MAG: competence/damage-inducible protein A [Clostridiales bacterium]|nr:competence/damage-inducible protein A [Clostridiales bacterium]
MIVELISVGTEILMGNIVNTNCAYLAEKCTSLGYSIYYQTTVGDNEERLMKALEQARERADIVILSGGLGPTMDDITKEMVAKVCQLELVEDIRTRERIQEYFAKRQLANITHNNWKQAYIPEGAIVLDNKNGTAPGLIVETDNCKFILLPGPPNELIPLMEQEVIPYLSKLQDSVFYTAMVKIGGLGESYVEDKLSDLMKNQTNPTIAPYAKEAEVHIRVTAKGTTEEEAKDLVAPVVKEIKSRFGNFVFTEEENMTLEDSVVELLKKHELKLCTVESCTGGLLAGRIVNVSGCSDVLKQGLITYSNKAKRKLVGVKKNTLKEYGAVSQQTAKEMAKGAALLYNSDVAVSITGIAGPTCGTEEKPVGLVYIGCYIHDKVFAKEFHFTGNRRKIRESSVASALTLLHHAIIEYYEGGFAGEKEE